MISGEYDLVTGNESDAPPKGEGQRVLLERDCVIIPYCARHMIPFPRVNYMTKKNMPRYHRKNMHDSEECQAEPEVFNNQKEQKWTKVKIVVFMRVGRHFEPYCRR